MTGKTEEYLSNKYREGQVIYFKKINTKKSFEILAGSRTV